MISQEEVCVWFKNLEGYSRIELMCALLDSCLPLELRFLGTYLEYSAGKHYTHLQKWEKDANKTSTWLTDKEDFFNKDFRRKFCIFLALLHSHNRSIAVKLFDVLNKWERCINSEAEKKSDNLNSRKKQEENCDKVSFCNEMRLLFSMASLHPALDFAQRAKLRNKKESFVSSCQKPDTEHLYEIENGYIEVDDNSDSDLPTENLDTSKLDSLPKEETRISTTRTPSLSSNNTLTTQTSIEQHTETPIPAPVPTNRSMVPEALQNIPHLTNISVLDNNGFHQMPPYRTPPMLFSRPQMSSTGTVYHRTLDPQSIQMPVGMPTIQCVVNNQQYVQNNISIHANSNTKNIGNVFSPTTSADLSRQSPLVPSELTIQQSPLVPNNDLLRVQSPLIPSNRTSDTLNNFNIVKLPGSQYGQIPRTMMNGPIGSPSLDDGSIPAHARHSGNVIVTCSGMVGGVSTVVSSMASINHQSNNQRRCYSESDANENINLGGSQEQLPLNQPRLIPYENKFHYFNSMQQMPFGNSQVHMSPKFFTATQNIQNMSTNNTVNISDSTPVPHQQQPIIIPYNTQQQQQQQQQRQQNQQQHQQHNMHNNMSSMVVHSTMPNIMTTNTAPVSVNPTPQQSLPTSKTEDKQPPPLMNQVISPSLTKNIPLGANGTYMPSQLPEKGISGNRILYSEQQRKFDFFMTKSDNNSNRSLPIPVQRRPYHNVNRYSNDVSPASSPSSSPRPSPLCSPSHSPLPSRRTTINTSTILTTSNKEFSDIYANTVNWLKSIRLHKYSNDLEHLSFKELSDMDEGSFKKIGLTVGASTKLKTQLDVLVNRGFKEFGDPDNLTNPDLPQHGTSPSSLSPISAKYLNSGTTTQQQQSSDPHPVKLDDEDSKSMTNRVVVVHEDSLLNDGVEMNERGDGINERENEHSDEDDEVFQQQQHEARKKSSSVTATCYNCGHVGHYGDECTDETMEAITYNRYAFQLDYSRNESPTSSNTSTSSVKSSTVTVTTPITSKTSVTMTTDDVTNR